MTNVGVEGQEERRPLDDEAHAGMSVTMDAPFVSLGQPEPPFQRQVVVRKSVVIADLHEQPGGEALHHAGHRDVEGRRLRSKLTSHLVKVVPAILERTRGWIECAINGAEIDDVVRHLIEAFLCGGDALVDALREAP